MTAAFEQVKALVPKLSPDERQKIRMLLTKHSGIKVSLSAPSKNDVQADWLLQGMLAELKRRGQRYHVTEMAHVRSLCADYEMSAATVREHLEEMLDNPSRAELLTLGSIVAKALIVRFPKKPVGLRPLLQGAPRALEALDDSFPGYLASGMLGCLLTKRL